MTQEKKKSLLLLSASTIALVVGFVSIFWATIILEPKERGMGIIALIMMAMAIFIATPAAIADIKILLKKNENKEG